MRKAIRSMVAALAVTCAVAAVSVPTLAASTPENADVRPTAPAGEYTFEMAEWDRIHAIAGVLSTPPAPAAASTTGPAREMSTSATPAATARQLSRALRV